MDSVFDDSISTECKLNCKSVKCMNEPFYTHYDLFMRISPVITTHLMILRTSFYFSCENK